jgi:hypothetical protein
MKSRPLDCLGDITIGELVSLMRISRRCLADCGLDWPPLPHAIYVADQLARVAIREAVDVDGDSDINDVERRADAVLEALGLAGLRQRLSAVDHQLRARADARDLVDSISRQLAEAIARLHELHRNRFRTTLVARWQTPGNGRPGTTL